MKVNNVKLNLFMFCRLLAGHITSIYPLQYFVLYLALAVNALLLKQSVRVTAASTGICL